MPAASDVRAASARVLHAGLGADAPHRCAKSSNCSREHGVERVHVRRFSRAFASLSPEAFETGPGARAARALGAGRRRLPLRRAPRRRLRAAARGSESGTASTSRAMPDGDDRRRARVQLRGARGARVGRLDARAALLGRPYSISGRVVHGDKLGRQLGFATANVRCGTTGRRSPASSRCACMAWRTHAPRDGVASLGVRPTVTDSGRHVWKCTCSTSRRRSTASTCASSSCTRSATRRSTSTSKPCKAQIAHDCDVARRHPQAARPWLTTRTR